MIIQININRFGDSAFDKVECSVVFEDKDDQLCLSPESIANYLYEYLEKIIPRIPKSSQSKCDECDGFGNNLNSGIYGTKCKVCAPRIT